MDNITEPVSDKVSKLKKLKAYEVLLESLGKLLAEIRDENINILDFRTHLRVFINKLIQEAAGHEDFYIRLLSCLETPGRFLSHCLNTAIFSFILSNYLKIDHSIMVKIITAALFHDIGKMDFDENIRTLYQFRNEDPKMTNKYHPIWGERLLLYHLKMLPEVARLVLNHHERNDGTGYPRGLKENDLSVEDYIVIAANTVDNLLQQTNYDCMDTLGKAINALLEKNSTIFNPAVKSALNEIFNLKNEVRKSKRYKLSSKCLIEDMMLGVMNPCEINNISSGGLEIITPEDLNRLAVYKLNSRISVSLYLKEKFCKIVWKKKQRNKYSYGLKFETPDIPVVQKALNELELKK